MRIIFEREVVVLVVFEDYKNIVKIYGWIIGKRSCFFVLEYMDDDFFSLLYYRILIKYDLVGLNGDM